MVTKSKLKELKKESKSLNSIIRIGKNGLTSGLIKEINDHLKKRKLIKVKVLRSCLDDNTLDIIIMKIMRNCESCILIDKIGGTFSIYRGKFD